MTQRRTLIWKHNLKKFLARLLLLACCGLASLAQGDAAPPNVLFIMTDDLNTDLGCYGNGIVHSPRIDQLSQQGVRFNRAYCTATTCIPSRTAMLTGLRPQTTDIYGPQPAKNLNYLERFPGLVTLPQLFQANGYNVIQIGKISDTRNDDPRLWTRTSKTNLRFHEDVRALQVANGAEIQDRIDKAQKAGSWFYAYWGQTDAGEEALGDGAMATEAVGVLKELASQPDKPFFLGVGFRRPHVDLTAPKADYDLYREADIPLRGNYDNKIPPKKNWDLGLPNVFDSEKAFVHSEFREDANRAYYASVTYVDRQIGRVLDALRETGLDKDTIIVLTSDHGFLLGDHAHWGKSTFYEGVWRVPLVMVVPGMTPAGKEAEGMVELIDLYPTLAELCGLKPPANLDGRSFAPLLADPSREGRPAVYSVNNARWEFVRDGRWKLARGPKDKGSKGVLFDLQNDPHEENNLYFKPEYQDQVRQLTAQLDALKPQAKPSDD